LLHCNIGDGDESLSFSSTERGVHVARIRLLAEAIIAAGMAIAGVIGVVLPG
jgi:hypothetical protein